MKPLADQGEPGMSLSEWTFTDLYLSASVRYMAGVPGSPTPIAVPGALADEAEALYRHCVYHHQSLSAEVDEFTLGHQRQRYRVSKLVSINNAVYVLRRLPSETPRLRSLGISHRLIEPVLRAEATGLVLVAGGFGEGKTSTASALVSERLHRNGGVAVTLEDPPEMPLEGGHGDGVCFQTWVTQEKGGFAEQLRRVARWAPTLIFLGEIRDPATAGEALKAATNGRLVLATIHAAGVVSAIERLHALASGPGGQPSSNGGDLAQILGSGVTAVFHQHLHRQGEARYRPPQIRFLHTEDPTEARTVQTHIASRHFERLGDVMRRQRERMRRYRQDAAPQGGS